MKKKLARPPKGFRLWVRNDGAKIKNRMMARKRIWRI
jgi:hypothetical protein